MKRRAVLAMAAATTLAASGLVTILAGAGAEKGGTVAGRVVITDDDGDKVKDRSDVVVYLDGVPNDLPDQSKVIHKIRQKDKQFHPRTLVALEGSTVDFPNMDKIDHNVFSLSRPARFDLGLYRSGTSKSVKLKRTGVVDVYCNIHPEMSAKILVLDTKYHATTNRRGDFRIDNVPPGKYKVVAWQARGEPFEGEVEVSAGGVAKPSIRLVRTEKFHQRHRRKDGTPYGRYK